MSINRICLIDSNGCRANISFIIYAATQISEIVASPLSAWLMSWTPWLPYFLGVVVMLCGLFASICVPETLPKSNNLSETGSEVDEADDDAPQTVHHRLKGVLNATLFVSQSPF